MCDEKYCPFLDDKCIKEQCNLWCEDTENCDIIEFTKVVRKLHDSVDNMNELIGSLKRSVNELNNRLRFIR